ncbi:MAG TPA: hypothetical protein PLL80_00325 [Candidatus Pacearchaeota archaeon]|nr:hypothetical protein [Candidatus Pacearchaeota archaeon]HOK93976.1 hypothetical protein [Candidatus Pacearchaeota archaeon]HPO75047.1 hypothetical protein [Candidatus Pacearchaeota archaeon]
MAEESSSPKNAPPIKTVSPTDPDFIIFLIFAILVDGLDVILEFIGGTLDFVGGIGELLQPLSWLIDNITLLILGLWMYFKGKEIGESKKQQKEAIQKKAAAQKEKIEVKAKKAGEKSPVRRILLRLGACFLGEIFPFIIGILPFWTFSVIMMLRVK